MLTTHGRESKEYSLSSMLCKASGFRRRGPGRKLSGARPRRPARESCGWRLPESAQCLSVTGKYRDHLAAREQNDNLTFMGYRGTEGSRTPDSWQGQPPGRPRSYSASAALEPSDGDSGGPSRGPARGFPPAPGQPDPVYLHDDFDAWSDDSDDTDAGGQDGPHQDQWHAPAAGGQWDGAPVSEWESTGTHPGTGTGDWGEAGRTGEWAGSQTAEWARADEAGAARRRSRSLGPGGALGPGEALGPGARGRPALGRRQRPLGRTVRPLGRERRVARSRRPWRPRWPRLPGRPQLPGRGRSPGRLRPRRLRHRRPGRHRGVGFSRLPGLPA